MKTLVKRLGVFGFLFFFVKGLLWLAVPAALAAYGLSGSEKDAGAEAPAAASVEAAEPENDAR